MSDTHNRNLKRTLNRHPYADTFNRPASTDPGRWSVRGIIKGHIHPQILERFGWLLWLLIFSGISAAQPGSERVLDRFDYDGDAAAHAVWQAREAAPPVRTASDGGLFFDCPFGSLADDRFYWDRAVTLDLSGETALTLELAAAHPDALRSLALYMESGDGWYIWNRPLTRSGRQRITMYRDDFETEGNPAGWHQIERLRLSPWRGARAIDTRLQVYSLQVSTPPVLLLRATESVPNNNERNAARRATRYISRRLNALGIGHSVIDEDALTPPMLKSAHVVILAYNPVLPDGIYDKIAAFLDRDGKVMVFYSADQRLAQRMGFALDEYRAATVPLQWSAFTFDDPGTWRIPSRVLQHSWNIQPIRPLRDDAEIIGWWENADGDPTDDPAWGASRNGTWMTHILLDGDNTNKENLLAGFLTRWIPALWPGIVTTAIEQSGRIGSYTNLAETTDALQTDARGLAPAVQRTVEDKLALAVQCHRRAHWAFERSRYIQAFSQARATRRLLVEAMAMTMPPPPEGEMRGVWDHHAVGWYPGDWPRSARQLRQHGITAIFANVAWAGLAHYDSQILPHSPTQQRFGDQLNAVRNAAHAHDLELHAWIVCWNLGSSPSSFRERMQQQNRLQRDANGKPLAWLCPSHPDNQHHMLEVIREIAGYRPDGIHLDYIRFPGSHACYCDSCRQQIELALDQTLPSWPAAARDGGAAAAAWTEQRVTTINRFVRQAHRVVSEIDENMAFSAAVFGNYPGTIDSIGQDWGRWMAAGWLDFVAPMNYTQDTTEYSRWLREQKKGPAANGDRLIPGIGVSSGQAPLKADQVLDQIGATRRLGLPGYILFALDHELREQILPMLQPLPQAER